MSFETRPERPSPALLDQAEDVLGRRLGLQTDQVRWEVGRRLDRKRSTLFPLRLVLDNETVATAYYKKPYFPGERRRSRNLPRARTAILNGATIGVWFAELATGEDIAINETLALEPDTLEVITLGLEGPPMGNPIRMMFDGDRRAEALETCRRVGRAVRLMEQLPMPNPETEKERIWGETERKLRSLSGVLGFSERRRLHALLGDLLEESVTQPTPLSVAHGDLSPGNVIMMEGKTGLIDFMWAPQLRGFDLARFVHRLRYTTVSYRPWTERLVDAVLEGYGDATAPLQPGWRFTEMQRLLGTAQRGHRMIPEPIRPGRRAVSEIRSALAASGVAERGDDGEMTPFVFFVGTNGSGTTLHRAIFDSHPDLAIPGEARFVAKLAGRRDRYETSPFDTDRFLQDLGKEDRFSNWGLDFDDVEKALSDPLVTDLPDAIRRLYRMFATKEGKGRYGDKTQANIHHLILLADLFPEARFVHAVRDGRDVALAHTDGTKIEQVAISWKRRVTAGREAGAQLGADRYIESRFEELIDDTESAVRRICEFIDLPFDPQMLKYYERAGDIVATTAVPERHKDIFLPPTKGLKDWRRDLSDDQVARFEALAGDLLSDLGYERRFRRIPWSARAAALSQLASDGARYVVRRARKAIG